MGPVEPGWRDRVSPTHRSSGGLSPSGADRDTGPLADTRVTPEAPLTLALPKRGLVEAPADAIGRRLLADIGVHTVLYQRFDAPIPVFRNGPILAF